MTPYTDIFLSGNTHLKWCFNIMMQYGHKKGLSALHDTLGLVLKCNSRKWQMCMYAKFFLKKCVCECAHLNVSSCAWIAVLMVVPVHLVRRQWAQLLSMPAGH